MAETTPAAAGDAKSTTQGVIYDANPTHIRELGGVDFEKMGVTDHGLKGNNTMVFKGGETVQVPAAVGQALLNHELVAGEFKKA